MHNAICQIKEEDYKRLVESIFNKFPSFQKVGGVAYKPGLERMEEIARLTGSPQGEFRSLHIAGTNGKGSTSHLLASVLIGCGLKVGLYTSPHLWDFRERIKVSTSSTTERSAMQMVSKEFVYEFLQRYLPALERMEASFFEITTAMAFCYFAHCKVDVAVVECGLGGRLDSTNIISPDLSIITNIGKDHCEHLGYELSQIATEKAGIIKPGIPAVIGEASEESVRRVFIEHALKKGADILFADEGPGLDCISAGSGEELLQESDLLQGMDLKGSYQRKNLRTVRAALSLLERNPYYSERVRKAGIGRLRDSICRAAEVTGLHGRWEHLIADEFGRLHFTKPYSTRPCPASADGACCNIEIICDTGHNAHGFAETGPQIAALARQQVASAAQGASPRQLTMLFGCVADKDLDAVIPLLPNEYAPGFRAYYLFVNAAGGRAMPARVLAERMLAAGFRGEAVEPDIAGGSSVMKALRLYFSSRCHPGDLLFIGGSSYVVASLEIE